MTQEKNITQNFDNSNENNIEFLTGQKRITFTFTGRKWINKIKKYKIRYPDEIDFVENNDGSICGHVPITWLKISPPRKVNLTEEQKGILSERMRQLHNKQ